MSAFVLAITVLFPEFMVEFCRILRLQKQKSVRFESSEAFHNQRMGEGDHEKSDK